MYLYRNIEALSYNYCFRGKAISITHFEYVFLALDINHAMRMRHSVFCGLSGSTQFFYIISLTVRLSEKVIEHKMCVLIFSTILSKKFLILRIIVPHIIRHTRMSSCKLPAILVIF